LWEQQDSERKAQWWQLAHQTAKLLRSEFNIKRIAVIGDLTDSKPLNYWSNITLFVWGHTKTSRLQNLPSAI
jgi:hypothetical protein